MSAIFSSRLQAAAAVMLMMTLLAATCADAQPQPTTVPPVPWPLVHTHQEVQYTMKTPGYTQMKEFFYDFPAMQLKVVGQYLAGPALYRNSTIESYWLNNTLSIITSVGFGIPAVCVELDMGFGMMRPTWMSRDSTHMGDLFLTRSFNGFAPDNTFARWTQKSAGSEGNFHYFSNATTGLPYRMDGPSPAGRVVNEYLNFRNVTAFAPTTFALPSGLTCKKVATLAEAELFFQYTLSQTTLVDAAVAHMHSLVLAARQ